MPHKPKQTSAPNTDAPKPIEAPDHVKGVQVQKQKPQKTRFKKGG